MRILKRGGGGGGGENTCKIVANFEKYSIFVLFLGYTIWNEKNVGKITSNGNFR